MGLRSFVRSLGSECRIVILRPNAGWHERKPSAVTRDLFAAIHISSLGVIRPCGRISIREERYDRAALAGLDETSRWRRL
jgi:hypothetical protein